jgi:hypothetical protein
LQDPCPSYRYRHFPAGSPVLSSPIFWETRDHVEDWHDGFDWIAATRKRRSGDLPRSTWGAGAQSGRGSVGLLA